MQTDEKAARRLLILFAFQKVGAQVTREQIAPVLLNTTDLSWIDLQLTIDALIRDGLLTENPDDRGLLLSSSGRGVLRVYHEHIPEQTREAMLTFIRLNKDTLLRTDSVSGHFEKKGGRYEVVLRLTESEQDQFNLKLYAPTRALAQQICRSWKAHPQKLYTAIIRLLTKA